MATVSLSLSLSLYLSLSLSLSLSLPLSLYLAHAHFHLRFGLSVIDVLNCCDMAARGCGAGAEAHAPVHAPFYIAALFFIARAHCVLTCTTPMPRRCPAPRIPDERAPRGRGASAKLHLHTGREQSCHTPPPQRCSARWTCSRPSRRSQGWRYQPA